MGACVSNHQKASAIKVQVLFESNDLNLVKPPVINGDLEANPSRPVSESAPSFRNFGSKDEAFFDSQAWLDSDCDDDFMSVNGEFTPSRGNTPVHHNFSAGNKNPPVSPSPNDSENKMRLSDLFKDSLRGNYDSEFEKDGEPANKIIDGGDVAANGGNGLKTKRERFGRSVQNCFPSLISSRNSSTNGRKLMSPGLGHSPGPNPVVG